MQGTRRPNRYYIKWLLLCFFMTSLPVIVLGLFSYAKSSGMIQEKVGEEKALHLQQTQSTVEQTLKIVDQATTHFLSSKLMLTVLNEPLGPDQFQLYSQVKAELAGLQRLDTGIEEIMLWSKRGHWLIDNDGLFRLDARQRNGNRFLPPEPEQPSRWRITRAGEGEGAATGSELGCSSTVTLLKRLPLTGYQSTGGAMIHIPACNLMKSIPVHEEESVLLLNEHGERIASSGFADAELTSAAAQSVFSYTRTNGVKAGQFPLDYEDHAYTIIFRSSEYNDWIYISVVTLDKLMMQSREIGWYTLYICLGLLLLFSLLSWYGSKRLYRPIDTIFAHAAAQHEGNVPDKRIDAIQFIGSHMSQLFVTKQQLENQLHGQTELLRSFFMVKLFLGGMKESEIAERLHSFGLSSELNGYYVLAVQLGDLERTRFSPKDTDLLLFAINNMVTELIPPDRRLQPIILGRSQLTVMAAPQTEVSAGESNPATNADMYAVAAMIREKLMELLGLPVHIGISQSYRQLSDAPRAYEEAVEVLKRRTALTNDMVAIVYFGDLGENHGLQYAYPQELQEELFDAIKLADSEAASRLLGQVLQELVRSNTDSHDLQFHAVRLLMNLLGLANSLAAQAIPMQKQQSLLDDLFALDIAKHGEGWFLDRIVHPLIEVTRGQTGDRLLSLSKDMVRMIHDQFDTDLTIDMCAERLHYNATYLGAIFKKSMDMTFAAYLAQHRHQVALKWLTETDMPIKDIAERLRYNNSQNFIRSFRKKEGVSPGKYREQARGTEYGVIAGEGE